MVDFATASSRRAIAFLILCGLPFFPCSDHHIHSADRRDEAYRPANAQMVEIASAFRVDIRFQDDVRYKKPVGVYWLQAATVETASTLLPPRRCHDPFGPFV